MRWLLTILLLGIALQLQATTEITSYRIDPANPNIVVGLHNSGNAPFPERRHRAFLFQALAAKLATAMGKRDQQVYVYWNGGELPFGKRVYTLGYSSGRINVHNPAMHVGMHPEESSGISINCYDNDIDIRIALKLLAAAYRDLNSIKREQNRFIIKHSWRGDDAPADTIPTLPIGRVWEIAIDYDPLVDSLMRLKTFRNSHLDSFPGIDYYLQNNWYHFYRSQEASYYEGWHQEIDSAQYPVGQVFLSLHQVTEIVGSPKDGHCIFSDDSTFYYLDPGQLRMRGPFVIRGATPHRAGIRGLHGIGMGRFLIDIDDYRNPTTQVFFDAESGIIISDYSTIQDSIIALRTQSPAPMITPEVPKAKPRGIPVLPFVMVALLSLSGLALVLTRRNS